MSNNGVDKDLSDYFDLMTSLISDKDNKKDDNSHVVNGKLVPIWSNIDELPRSEHGKAKFYYLDESLAPTEPITEDAFCYHDWKDYKGFTESYKYCTKCDKKE